MSSGGCIATIVIIVVLGAAAVGIYFGIKNGQQAVGTYPPGGASGGPWQS